MGKARYLLRQVRKSELSEGNRVVTRGKCPISAASGIEELSDGASGCGGLDSADRGRPWPREWEGPAA